MDRRRAIKNLALVIGGAALLPSCLQEKGKSTVNLKHLDISADQEQLIGDVSDTIIPRTDTPGAKDLQIHLFVLKMLDDCTRKPQQQAFLTGLGQFEDLTKQKYNRRFAECDVKDREALLRNIEAQMKREMEEASKKAAAKPASSGAAKAPKEKELYTFYNLVKQYTVFGYTNSKYFMTKQIVYELVPGRYNAFYPANKVGNKA